MPPTSYRPCYFRDLKHLYPITSNHYYRFVAGHSGSEQILAGIVDGSVVRITFDTSGMLCDVQVDALSVPLHVDVSPLLQSEWKESQAKLLIPHSGIHDGTIHIRRFYLPDLHVGVADIPTVLEQFAIDFQDQNSPDQWVLEEVARSWKESGQYVLHWGQDYWVCEGWVVAD